VSFCEVDLFGVYVSPAALVLVAAALAFVVLRRATDGIGVLRRVWHPALFEFAVYVILASCITLLIASRSG
jgi:protein AaeX